MPRPASTRATGGRPGLSKSESPLSSAQHSAWAKHHDTIGALLAALYGLPSLAYPFGRDQALFFYIGREWTVGRIPYRDAFDNKPPGIFALYALASELLGTHQWTIRLVELAAVLLMGSLIARAIQRDGPSRPGEVGSAMLLTSGLYYTVFDYWDTGQVEFWEGLFALAGYVTAQRVRSWRVAALASGALGAITVLFKWPGAVLLPVAALVVIRRACRTAHGPLGTKLRRALSAAGWHGLGICAVGGLVIGYFYACGAMKALEELFGYTSTYVLNTPASLPQALESTQLLWREVFRLWSVFLALGYLIGVVLAVRRRAWRVLGGALVAALLVTLSAASVVLQFKFYPYHWVVLTPFLLLCCAYGSAELARRWQSLPLRVSLTVVLIGYFGAPNWITNARVTYRTYTHSFWSYMRGETRRSAFLQQFLGPFNYRYAVQERIGDQIGDRANPGDGLHVRGFEPAIYAVSGLASPSRFASEMPLGASQLSYNREAWAAEHDAILWVTRPRFFVTFLWAPADMALVEAHGYRRMGEHAPFVWFERTGGDLPP